MLKFLFGLALIAFTSFCGYLLAGKYRRRKQFFTQLKEFNERFLTEISYYRRPLGEFVGKYSYQGDFRELLSDYFDRIADGERVRGILSKKGKYGFLTEEERTMTEDYFTMLGKGDSVSQKGYFSSVKNQLSTFQSEAETTAKRYGDLYVKLGFLCGLLLLILIV